MNIVTLDVNHPLWSSTLEQLPHDVYHLPDYVDLDAKRTETTPEAFLLEEDDKIFFAPYLLRSCGDILGSTETKVYDIISPYGYPGILMSQAATEHPEFPEFALQQFRHTLQKRGVCSAFLRLHPILGEGFAKVFQSERLSENGKTVSIDLTLDEGKIWAKTRRGHQSTINKCMRLGFTAKTVSYAEYIDEFIMIYEETMNRVKAQDSYYFSRDYFEGLLRLGDKVHLGVVELEEEIVCACLFFESCGIVQAHLGGTKSEFLKKSPFNLLLHQMRLWAKARGNKYLHIG
ncbi:MAG: GNAT family N-acetyltransferase, partial [Cyanobacteria bacterium J06600_6]